MQLLDAALLISIAGVPAKKLSKWVVAWHACVRGQQQSTLAASVWRSHAALLYFLHTRPRVYARELDCYSRATSSEGLLCIRKYWDAHCSTFSRLPAIALLDQSSCPRGLEAAFFVQLLSRLTDLQQYQIWDLRDSLDVHSCGFVGCPEFALLVVLMCAALSGRQLQAVHAYSSQIHRVFTGAQVTSSYAGLSQCCQLLGLPVASLRACLQELQLQHWSSVGSSSSSRRCTCVRHSIRVHNAPGSCPAANGVIHCCCGNSCCKHQAAAAVAAARAASLNAAATPWRSSSCASAAAVSAGFSHSNQHSARNGLHCSCPRASAAGQNGQDGPLEVNEQAVQLLLFSTVQKSTHDAAIGGSDGGVSSSSSSSSGCVPCRVS